MATIESAQTGAWETTTTWTGGVVPVTGDSVSILPTHTVTFSATSAAFNLNSGQALNIAGVGVLNITGGALTVSSGATLDIVGTLDVGADFTFGGTYSGNGAISIDGSADFTGSGWVSFTGSFTFDGAAGAHTVTYGGVTAPALTINNSGTTSLTAQDACTTPSFTHSAGVYTDGGFAHNIAGNISIVGTLTSTGTWTQTTAGNLANPTSTNKFASLVLNAAATATGNIYANALGGNGSLSLGANGLLLFRPSANNFYTATCSYTATSGRITIQVDADRSNAAAINLTGVSTWFYTGGLDKTLTVAGLFACGALEISAYTNTKIAHLVANGGLTAGGAVSLGYAGQADIGKLTLAGVCVLGAGLARATGNTATTHELNLGSSYTTLTGTINGANILFSNTACAIQSGTVSNLTDDPGVKIHCYGTTLTDCTAAYIDTNSHAPPGSLAMSGVGI